MLIVDDEEDILIFLSYHFNKNGFDVTTALDGTIGLSEFEKKKFDIVITDIRMPNMDGIEMCGEIKKQDDTTPIIFLTAVTDDYKILQSFGDLMEKQFKSYLKNTKKPQRPNINLTNLK